MTSGKEAYDGIFRILDKDEIQEPYSTTADWDKVIKDYSTTYIYESYAHILKLRPRKWYLDYLKVIYKFT